MALLQIRCDVAGMARETSFSVELHGADGAALRLPAGAEAATGTLVFAH